MRDNDSAMQLAAAQLRSCRLRAGQMATISISTVEVDSFASTAHVREESNAPLFCRDRNKAVKAEASKYRSWELEVVSRFA